MMCINASSAENTAIKPH